MSNRNQNQRASLFLRFSIPHLAFSAAWPSRRPLSVVRSLRLPATLSRSASAAPVSGLGLVELPLNGLETVETPVNQGFMTNRVFGPWQARRRVAPPLGYGGSRLSLLTLNIGKNEGSEKHQNASKRILERFPVGMVLQNLLACLWLVLGFILLLLFL